MDARMRKVFEAVNLLLCDPGVTPEQSLEQIEEIIADLEVRCDALRADIRARQKPEPWEEP